MKKTSSLALAPLFVFLCLFIGVGSYYSYLGVEYAFYKLPAPVAILPAIILAFVLNGVLNKAKVNQTLESFMKGVGHPDIIAMCLIYLLAGAFAAVAKASGGVDATLNLGLSVIPSSLILPGLFLITAFIATAMGTSMGTIAAISPIAFGLGETMNLPLVAGVVLSGAMFGDNLSIISDTTIAATRSQGCQMKDKFTENIKIALPAALITLVVFFFLGQLKELPPVQSIEWLKVLPYLSILILAVLGVNVFVVLSFGILFAGIVGMSTLSAYGLSEFASDIYSGFGNMQEIFLLSMLIGGLSELMRRQGGLDFLTELVNRLMSAVNSHPSQKSKRSAEFGIGVLVSIINICTANNTVAIIVSGSVAKKLAQENQISAKRSASLLDIFSCVFQGVLPYGAQVLLVGSAFKLAPFEIISHSYYCFILAIVTIASIISGT